jgi:hypothetical protein
MKTLATILLLAATLCTATPLAAQTPGQLALENVLTIHFNVSSQKFASHVPPRLVANAAMYGDGPYAVRAALLASYSDMLGLGFGVPSSEGWVWAHSYEGQIDYTVNGVSVSWGVGGIVSLSGAGVAIAMGEEGGNSTVLNSADSSSFAVVILEGTGGSGYAVGGAGYSQLPGHIASESFAGTPEHGGYAFVTRNNSTAPENTRAFAWGGHGFDSGYGGDAEVFLPAGIQIRAEGGPSDQGNGGSARAEGGAASTFSIVEAWGGPAIYNGAGGLAEALGTAQSASAFAQGGLGAGLGSGGLASAEANGAVAEAFGGSALDSGDGGEAYAIANSASGLATATGGAALGTGNGGYAESIGINGNAKAVAAGGDSIDGDAGGAKAETIDGNAEAHGGDTQNGVWAGTAWAACNGGGDALAIGGEGGVRGGYAEASTLTGISSRAEGGWGTGFGGGARCYAYRMSGNVIATAVGGDSSGLAGFALAKAPNSSQASAHAFSGSGVGGGDAALWAHAESGDYAEAVGGQGVSGGYAEAHGVWVGAVGGDATGNGHGGHAVAYGFDVQAIGGSAMGNGTGGQAYAIASGTGCTALAIGGASHGAGDGGTAYAEAFGPGFPNVASNVFAWGGEALGTGSAGAAEARGDATGIGVWVTALGGDAADGNGGEAYSYGEDLGRALAQGGWTNSGIGGFAQANSEDGAANATGGLSDLGTGGEAESYSENGSSLAVGGSSNSGGGGLATSNSLNGNASAFGGGAGTDGSGGAAIAHSDLGAANATGGHGAGNGNGGEATARSVVGNATATGGNGAGSGNGGNADAKGDLPLQPGQVFGDPPHRAFATSGSGGSGGSGGEARASREYDSGTGTYVWSTGWVSSGGQNGITRNR